MQQVKCIKAFGNAKPGDVAEVPDGAAVDPEHWVPVSGDPPPADDLPPAVITASGGITLPPPAAATPAVSATPVKGA